MCLGIQGLIPLISPPPLSKDIRISKWLILGRKHLLGFFFITLNKHHEWEIWVFCLSSVFSLISKSDNKVFVSEWIYPTFPKQKRMISCVTWPLPFPSMDRVTVDGWTGRLYITVEADDHCFILNCYSLSASLPICCVVLDYLQAQGP